MPKKRTKRQSEGSWNTLIVATVDSLPNGVFLLLITAAKSPDIAAQKKAASIGIPGKVEVIRQFPLNKTTGKAVFQELLGSFQEFPYGDSDCLVQATASAISRKYSQLSNQDPDQIELRKQVVQQQIEEQQEILDSIKAEVLRQTGEVARLSSQKRQLIEEIGDLEQENSSLSELVRNIKIKVWELEELYDNLKQLAELDGDERGYDDYEERENIMFSVRLLLERYSEE